MRKLTVLVFALVACIAVGAVTMATAKTTKVKTEVSVDFSGKFSGGNPTGNPYSPYTPITFNGDFAGKVKGKKGCKKSRKVTISGGIGSTKSNKSGNYDVAVSKVPASGDYTATAKKKKFKKNGNKIVCKKAKDTVHVG
jgi:hypothetical protein